MHKRILLVDDDPAICEGLTELLQLDGYSVTRAANGREALAHLRETAADPPGLILLDLMMPVMNGVEFLDAYKADPSLPPVPVVVLSCNVAFSGPNHRTDILMHLTKPVNVPYLLETIDTWCA